MEESIAEGQKRYKSRLDKLKRTKKESRTVHGKLIYKRTLKEFTKGVEDLQRRATGRYAADWAYLQDLKPLLIAHLTLITLLDTLSVRQKRVSIAVKVGQKIFDEINFSFLRKNHPKWWKRVSKNVDKRISYGYKRNYAVRAAIREFGPEWMAHSSNTAKTHVGLSLVELFRQVTGLIDYSKNYIGKKRWEYIVLPTPDAFKWIERVNRKAETLSPFFLPTKYVPEDWKSLDEGGYRFPPEIHWKLIKGYERYDKTSNFSLLYSAANSLQRIPYRINRVLYKVSDIEYRSKVNESEKLWSIHKEALRESDYTLGYRQCQAKFHANRLKELPERIRVQNTLQLASRYSDTPFYLPVQSDFRGRLYYAPRYLNPQGSDLSRGLLEFATPTKVKGCEHWFLIGGANSFGIKGKYEERSQWVLDHEREIKQAASDPLSFKWWQEAASPYQFLAFCLEFTEWLQNRINFETHLPVRLDHHASGLQVIACLEKDTNLMRLTNVADVEQPNDIYEEILKGLLQLLRKSTRPENFHWASRIDRKLIKSLTVSLMYGSTYYGLERAVREWYFLQPDDIFGKNIYREIHKLIDLYSVALNNLSPTPLKFLREVQMRQRDEAVSFESPSGFTVINNYKNYKSQRVKATVNREIVVSRLNVEDEGINLRAAKKALVANLVHMYDAAIMHHVLNSRRWDNIQTLHDCYAIPPIDCDICIESIKNAMGAVFGIDMPANMWYAAS